MDTFHPRNWKSCCMAYDRAGSVVGGELNGLRTIHSGQWALQGVFRCCFWMFFLRWDRMWQTGLDGAERCVQMEYQLITSYPF